MDIQSLKAEVAPFLYVPAVFVVWTGVLWLVKRIVFFRLKKWAKKTKTFWDDTVIEALSFPVTLLILISGLVVACKTGDVPDKMDHFVTVALQAALIVAGVLFLDRMMKTVIDQNAYKKFFGSVSPGLVKGVARAFIIGIGVLILLDLLGISITPILASLGIGSLAVALALQDTLSNFFAGIYVAVDKPVQEGDYVKLETGDEGHVIDVGWRSTKLRTRQQNVVIIPNSKLIGSVITNFSLPTTGVVVPVTMGVAYGSDLEKVERAALDTAREVMARAKDADRGFKPGFAFTEFADSSINFTVGLQASNIEEAAPVKHDFIKSVYARFNREGIAIPYPVRTLELSKETLDGLKGIASK